MKRVLSILMIIVMLACMSTTVFAAGDKEGTEEETTTSTADTTFLDGLSASQQLQGDAGDSMKSIGSTILTIVTNVAMILAVVIIAVIGVKYMMGSIEEKAEYKKTMMPYLIGAILVFGAGAIGKMVVGIGVSLI